MTEFSSQGGRDGVISGQIKDRMGHMEYEMLVGKVYCVIYKSTGYWAGKDKVKMTIAEQETFLKEFEKWSTLKKFKYAVA